MSSLKIHPLDRKNEAVYKFLNSIPVFDQLDRDGLYVLLKYMGYTKLAEGETLFTQGDPANHVYYVAKGCLNVIKRLEDDTMVNLSIIRVGRSVGEMSILENNKRSATVIAQSDVTLLVISRRSFNDILDQHTSLGIKILKGIALLMSQNLRKTSSRLADYMLPLA